MINSHNIGIALFYLLSVAVDLSSGLGLSDGAFRDPPAKNRPRFRYWLPDSGVDPAIVKANIKTSGAIGAGGVEFLPFFNYGGTAPPGRDWSAYGFGTPAFKDVFRAALEGHQEAGLSMDFALGPNQGQGVPADPDDEGLQWDLIPFSTTVPAGGYFNGTVPGWGEGELVAVVSAVVVSATNNTVPSNFLRLVLRQGTLEDLTDQVSLSDGLLSTQLMPAGNASSYRLFSFYQRLTGGHNLPAPKNISQTIFDNGSYTVDHFSARGAQTVTNFWERDILTDGLKELLSEAGNCGWEDSLELRSNVSWTPSLPSRFADKLGYSIKAFLPLIMFGNNNINLQRTAPGAIQAVLDTEDQGFGYVNDYRAVLRDGYQDYLKALINWTDSYLNLPLSSQVSYNLPMDMEASIPLVGVPECESLQFRDNIDGYRQFSGSASLAGRNVISVELGAVFGDAYKYTIPRLVFSTNRAFSGGVNQMVIHGQSYTGNYTATTWPGYTAFGYGVSESYSEKRPDWNHGLDQALGYIGRTQYVQQQGIGKVDLAMFNRQTATNPVPNTLYTSNDLRSEGWTYAYLSPENFNLTQAYVRDGVLAPEGPAYKAMIVYGRQNLTLDDVTYLDQYAKSDLPIIFVGGPAGYYTSQDSSERIVVLDALAQLMTETNVYSAAEGQAAQKLQELGLTPRISTRTNGTWYSTWREDGETGIDYAFIFNDLNAASGEIHVSASKKPYFLNAWTGEISPLLNYNQSGNSTVIPLTLAGNQTTIIAFAEQPPDGLSSGTQIPLTALDTSSAFELGNWTLVAEHWEAPANINDASIIADKRNTTHVLDSLVSWLDIPQLSNASGLGYYTTTFDWPPSTNGSDDQTPGAYIQFPAVLDALTVSINGQRLPPLDFSNPIADISAYLEEGSNEVLAVVPTTMFNYLRSISSQLQNAGNAAFRSPPTGPTDNGLIGTVRIVPI